MVSEFLIFDFIFGFERSFIDGKGYVTKNIGGE